MHGGIKRAEFNVFTSHDERASQQIQEKERIGRLGARLIEENDIIFIDSGTTTAALANYLPLDLKVTVLTNNLDVINKFANMSSINLIVLGNQYYRETRSFIYCHYDQLTINNYNVDKAFLGTSGITANNGITNSDFYEIYIKKYIVERSSEVYVLSDQTKFGHASLHTFAEFKQVTGLITDAEPPTDIVDTCLNLGVDIIK